MIPSSFITAWSERAPWVENKLIELDLIICRALVSIYQDEFLASHLAFRGGTALHKLYLQPQPRYSEDIDLVQVQAEPIRETIDHLRDALAWLGGAGGEAEEAQQHAGVQGAAYGRGGGRDSPEGGD